MTRWWLGLVVLASCSTAGPNAPDVDESDGILSDALSMPRDPTVSIGDFNSAEVCGECHEQHYAEWKTSMHSYAMVDPIYRKLVALRQAERDGKEDKFCLQCHSAIATRGGEITPGFDFESLSPIALEGVTCEACHKVAALERPFNSGHRLDPTGPIRGSIENPAPSAFHESEYSELHTTSDFCGGCHDVFEVNGLNLERPFAEWLESPARLDDTPCQSCHMPTYQGEAVAGGEQRTLHRHRWVGVDIPLAEGFLSKEDESIVRDEVTALLSGAASIQLQATPTLTAGDTLDLYVTVRNNISAHAFPTGSTFNREVWVELVAVDANGNVLLKTGDLDDHGDLRGYFSELDPYGDSNLISFGSNLTTSSGQPVVFTWHAQEHFSRALSPLYDRTYTLFIPTSATTVGPITITARIRFRAFAPFLLRQLNLEQYADKIEIFDVDSTSYQVAVGAP